jgi:dCTP deaminase
MPFWRGEDLLIRGSKLVEPFVASQIDCNAYELRMGEKYFCTSDGTSTGSLTEGKVLITTGQSFVIPPGQFAYLLTKETIKVPHDAMAFISMRTPLKFEGLINVSGFHVDPGYEGKLLYAVFNAGPSAVALSENEPLFKIWFCDLTNLSQEESKDSKYKKQPIEGVNDIDNRLIHGMSPPIVSLQGLAQDLRAQQRALDSLENSVNAKFEIQKPTLEHLATVYRNLTTGLVVAAVVGLGALIFPTAAYEGVALRNWLFPQSAVQKPITRASRLPPLNKPSTKQTTSKPQPN